MAKTVIGFFDDNAQADRARTELIDEGISASDIKLFSNSSLGQSDQLKNTQRADYNDDTASFGERVKHFFTHLGEWNINDEYANYYAEGIRRGGYVLSVTADDQLIERAAEILDRNGAVDIDRRSEFYRETGYENFDMNAKPLSASESQDYRNKYQAWEKDRFASDKDQVIPVVEENVHIGKRAIEKGRVRILTKVSETPVEEQVQLRDERIDVQRRPVDRAINSADMAAFKEGEIELRETSEEPVVEKEARVVEEVVVSKQAKQRTETVRDKARRTDVTVDRDDKNVSDLSDRRMADDTLKKDTLRSTDKI